MPLDDFTIKQPNSREARTADHVMIIAGLDPSTQKIVPVGVDADGNFAITGGAPSTTATGTTRVRNLTLNSTAAVVKAGAGNIFGLNLVNLHSAAIFVKFYNKAAASVDPASDAPQVTIQVPASSTYTLRGSDLPYSFATAISMRCVTGGADTDTTAPGTLPIVELEIK